MRGKTTKSRKSGWLINSVAPLVLLLAACGGNRREYFYQTFADADRAGETTRGWIPDDLIPSSSRDIHLSEQLSPSKEWGAFEFPPGDSEILTRNLKSVGALPPSVQHVRSPGTSWWPEVLRGDLDLNKINKGGFQIYIVERPANSATNGIYLFALDRSRGRGFFYWIYKS